ncbi:hypothetical protein [Rhizobium johnstonii]|uniref:hypothetical protein n=1 Tax=Rhizobium johnstonii TaxID=3019933 RepID=UPI003F955433
MEESNCQGNVGGCLMGTGSFGGGSGSVGGGGSGSGSRGHGGSSDGAGNGGGTGAKGSLLRAIEGLREITRRLTADPDQARLTRVINELLRDRGRATFFSDMLTDGFAGALLNDLLAIGARLRAGEGWVQVTQSFGIDAGVGSMQALCDACIDRALQARAYQVDDRYIESASAAFREFMVASVGGDRILVTRGDAAQVDAAIDRNVFGNSIGGFLGDLIGQVLQAESYVDLGAATAAVRQASDTLAIAIFDRFDAKFVQRGKAERRDALRVIGENYFALVTAS